MAILVALFLLFCLAWSVLQCLLEYIWIQAWQVVAQLGITFIWGDLWSVVSIGLIPCCLEWIVSGRLGCWPNGRPFHPYFNYLWDLSLILSQTLTLSINSGILDLFIIFLHTLRSVQHSGVYVHHSNRLYAYASCVYACEVNSLNTNGIASSSILALSGQTNSLDIQSCLFW